jgi:hypothetical protein
MAFDDLGPEQIDALEVECARLVNECLKAFTTAQPLWDVVDTMYLADRILTDMYKANRIVILSLLTVGKHHGED